MSTSVTIDQLPAGSGVLAQGMMFPVRIGSVDYYITLQQALSLVTSASLGLGSGLTGTVGDHRNSSMIISTAGLTGTFTADSIIVETTDMTVQYRLNGINKIINIGTTGIGGMDHGAAPVSGIVGVYLIYNPTTNVYGLLGVNGSAAKLTEIYSGSYMPTGFTASALVSMWATDPSGNLIVGAQVGRRVEFPTVTV